MKEHSIKSIMSLCLSCIAAHIIFFTTIPNICAAETRQNFLMYGDFENVDILDYSVDTAAGNWYGKDAAIDTENHHKGSKSVLLGKQGYITQAVNLNAGVYTLVFYSNIEHFDFNVKIEERSEEQSYTELQQVKGSDSGAEWIKYTREFELKENKDCKISLYYTEDYADSETKNGCNIDDVILMKSKTEELENKIVNGDFSDGFKGEFEKSSWPAEQDGWYKAAESEIEIVDNSAVITSGGMAQYVNLESGIYRYTANISSQENTRIYFGISDLNYESFEQFGDEWYSYELSAGNNRISQGFHVHDSDDDDIVIVFKSAENVPVTISDVRLLHIPSPDIPEAVINYAEHKLTNLTPYNMYYIGYDEYSVGDVFEASESGSIDIPETYAGKKLKIVEIGDGIESSETEEGQTLWLGAYNTSPNPSDVVVQPTTVDGVGTVIGDDLQYSTDSEIWVAVPDSIPQGTEFYLRTTAQESGKYVYDEETQINVEVGAFASVPTDKIVIASPSVAEAEYVTAVTKGEGKATAYKAEFTFTPDKEYNNPKIQWKIEHSDTADTIGSTTITSGYWEPFDIQTFKAQGEKISYGLVINGQAFNADDAKVTAKFFYNKE